MNYRSEIDGLRALAVVPVILFHAGFTAFSGGFVGVDVFFVISGYLITSIILQEMNARTFTLAGFYERRARRILPALVFVITACIPFAWAWMQPDDFKEFFQSIVSVSLFASNIFFWRQSGYFDGDAELRPLLHTWTLAVEEQYYLFFPLLLLLLWRLGKRSIVPTIATLALLSFALAEWGSHNKPTPTFFLLPTRGWELLIGVCVALYLSERPDQPGHFRNRSISELGGFIGLCLIGYSILAFDKATPFPGVHALAPTIGTALIILCATPETTLGRFLGTNWLVSVGLISYSAYLWHQPLFAFARLRSFGEPGTVMFMCLAGLSMALAWLTWRYIESPFRDRTRTSRTTIFRTAAIATTALICVGFVGQIDGGFKHRWRLPENVARSLDDSALRRECVDRPQVVKAGDSFCRIGRAGRQPTFMVLGDSHALALLRAFDERATAANVAGAIGTANGCAPLLGIYLVPHDTGCNALNTSAFEYARANGIKQVFLAARWTYYTDGNYSGANLSHIGTAKDTKPSKDNSRAAFLDGLALTIDQYRSIGAELVVILQAPQQVVSAKDIYYRAYADRPGDLEAAIRSLSVPLSRHLGLQAFNREVFAVHAKAGRLSIVSPDPKLCDAALCPVGDASISRYFDKSHLSITGARMVLDAIRLRDND